LIKHISFDLWLTLIKSHPDFKERRAEYFKEKFNLGNLSVKYIMEVVQETDRVSDRMNEISGGKVPTNRMYQRIFLKLGIEPELITDELLNTIKTKVNELFLNLPPHFLNKSIQPMLYSLKNEGYVLNIGSNTGFIEGGTIVETLKNMNIGQFFDFCIFSDQIKASKPSKAFFDKVYDQINGDKNEVLHVGDNVKADYEGALNYGFKALHITNQLYTINDITRHL
jgi:putative hydrolase of the HAD superfamily